jgi:hypothetical protein
MSAWPLIVLIVLAASAAGAIYFAGRRAGTAAEASKARHAELKSQQEASDAKSRMLEAGAAAPRDRSGLTERLRDGSF